MREEKAAREVAEGELTKECEVATNLRWRCSELETKV
jgi:hypothetical protein